jgi:hypothetical protein
MDWRERLEARLCEEISLKQAYPLAGQPRIFLFGLDPLGDNVDPEIGADLADRPDNGLAWAMALYSGDKFHVQLYLVGLKFRKQVEPGIPCAKIIDRYLQSKAAVLVDQVAEM